MHYLYKIILISFIGITTLKAQSWTWKASDQFRSKTVPHKSYTHVDGTTIITGAYYDSSHLGKTVLVSSEYSSFFVAIISPSGHLIHSFSDGKAGGSCEISSITMDKKKNILMAGIAPSRIIFGNKTYLGKGLSMSMCFIAKYSYEGKLIWVKTFESIARFNNYSVKDLDTDDEGNIYCTGLHQELGLDLRDTILPPSQCAATNAFLLKYNVNGKLQWAKTIQVAGEDYIFSIGESLEIIHDKIYWFGWYAGDLTFQHITIKNSSHQDDLFIAALSTDGSLSWVKRINQNKQTEDIDETMVLGDSLLIVAGHLLDSLQIEDSFLRAYDLNGNCQWTNYLSYKKKTGLHLF